VRMALPRICPTGSARMNMILVWPVISIAISS
jgi:hypothetical protein